VNVKRSPELTELTMKATGALQVIRLVEFISSQAPRAVAHGVRLMLVLLLFTTAATKALDLSGMAAIVDDYRLLPATLTRPAAVAVTLSEATIGVLLVAPRSQVLGSLASATMHLVYFAWSALALARGLSIANCGCFGTFWPRPLSGMTLIEDVVLVVLSLWLALHFRAARR
jgi:hypothetical protein